MKARTVIPEMGQPEIPGTGLSPRASAHDVPEPSTQWRSCSEAPRLGANEVHLWRFPLDTLPRGNASAEMSHDEIDRASRFRFDRDRDRYVAGRATLRNLLGSYLGSPARQIRFSYGDAGKPSLSDAPEMQFNLAHSEALAVLVIALHHVVGVDVEHFRPDIELAELARQNFSVEEQREFASLPAAERVAGFFNCWTRKEAILKAHGGGLSVPLQLFDVTLRPGETPRIRATRPPLPPMDDWSLHSFAVDQACAAALAVASPMVHIQFLEWRS